MSQNKYTQLLESNFNPDLLRMQLHDEYLKGFQTACLMIAAKVEAAQFDGLDNKAVATIIRDILNDAV